ncbi:hypothetical protein D3C71_1679250 [compost metagenome]
MLQSNVLFYSITGDKKFLTEAQRIARAAKAHFYKHGKLPDHYWFNAVLFRGLIELNKIDHNKEWIDFYETDANRIWAEERSAEGLIGKKSVKSLIDQAAMMEVYARMHQMK